MSVPTIFSRPVKLCSTLTNIGLLLTEKEKYTVSTAESMRSMQLETTSVGDSSV